MPMPEQARSDIWAGGQFLDGSYTNQAGTRTYKLYIPSGYRGQALPLVVIAVPTRLLCNFRVTLKNEKHQPCEGVKI
jgi:hypothetical protein